MLKRGSEIIETSPDKLYHQLKRMDFGLNTIAGFAFNNGFQVSAGYEFTNVLHNASNFSVKNRVFNVSVGYSL